MTNQLVEKKDGKMYLSDQGKSLVQSAFDGGVDFKKVTGLTKNAFYKWDFYERPISKRGEVGLLKLEKFFQRSEEDGHEISEWSQTLDSAPLEEVIASLKRRLPNVEIKF